MDRQNPRANGKNKAILAKSHTEAYTYTLTKREKGKIYIYIYRCSQNPPPLLEMICCLFRYSTDAWYITLLVEI